MIISRALLAMLLVGCYAAGCKSDPPTMSLHDAAASGNVEQVKRNLHSGCDVNAPDAAGVAPLLAATNADVDEHRQIVQLLLDAGANINATRDDDLFVQGDKSITPLHSAAARGEDEMVKLLLDHHADRTAKTRNGFTPLDVASRSLANSPADAHLQRVVQLLK